MSKLCFGAQDGNLAAWVLGALLLVVLSAGTAAPVPAAQSRPLTVAVIPPPLIGNSWLNLTHSTKFSLAACKGKVVILHFWTFDCINCKRTLPYYAEWQKRFPTNNLVMVGIHTPETAAEKDPANVAREVKRLGITYPVLLDPNAENWKAWHQRVWPTVYLIDKRGRARYAWEGELEYQGAGGFAKMTSLIETLLHE